MNGVQKSNYVIILESNDGTRFYHVFAGRFRITFLQYYRTRIPPSRVQLHCIFRFEKNKNQKSSNEIITIAVDRKFRIVIKTQYYYLIIIVAES